jgi:hypothetical protein
MSDYLLIDPEKLYRIYSYKQLTLYYNYNFLPSYESFDIEILYDILNCLSIKQLQDINKFIFKQWSLTKHNLQKSDISPMKRKKNIIKLNYNSSNIHNQEQLNNKLINFIKNDKIIGIFIINKLLLFLYPC